MSTYTDPTVVSVGTGSKLQPGPLFALIAGIITVLFGGFLLLQTDLTKKATAKIDAEITDNTKKKDALRSTAEELTLFAQQNRNLKTLFDNQKRWENVLSMIEQKLYSNMVVTAFTLNSDGTFGMTGAVTDYNNYAKLYTSLTDQEAKKVFSSAKPVSVTKNPAKDGKPEEVVFSFTLTLNPDVLNVR